MANAAQKKLAVSNKNSLAFLHRVSLTVNAVFLVAYFVLGRPSSIKPYLFLSTPAVILEYQLEKMGRPRYDDKGVLINAGSDLSLGGLTEWFHDIIYLTWICDILAAITGSNKVWYLYFAIPVYAFYSIYTTFFSGNSSPLGALFRGAGAGGASDSSAVAPDQKSKRQEKLEKRGGQRIKYSR